MKTLLLNSLHSQRGTLTVSDPNIAFILAISVPLGDITDFNDVISAGGGEDTWLLDNLNWYADSDIDGIYNDGDSSGIPGDNSYITEPFIVNELVSFPCSTSVLDLEKLIP